VLFAEEHARWLLLLHTILAVAAVATSTHLVVWLWKLRRGAAGRIRGARTFALLAAALHLATFVAGNLMYPTYKVRVKVSHLQNPDAILDEGAERLRRDAEVRRRYDDAAPAEPTEGQIQRATAGRPDAADRIARWFDSKEHWVAMGLALAIGLAFLIPAWRPGDDNAEVGRFVFLMAIGACATLWFGAIVGVVVASWRAVA
jgi:hypothetical protein